MQFLRTNLLVDWNSGPWSPAYAAPMLLFFFFLFCAARHPADFDGRPTAGAQVLASVSMIPRYPYHSGPALHSRVPSRPVSS